MTSPGARATAAATGHLSVLLGLFVALKAIAYWLDRYGLAVKSSDFKSADNWTGLRYVDANAYLPAKTILFASPRSAPCCSSPRCGGAPGSCR